MKKSNQRAVRLFLAALFRLGGHIRISHLVFRISPVESGKAWVSFNRFLGFARNDGWEYRISNKEFRIMKAGEAWWG